MGKTRDLLGRQQMKVDALESLIKELQDQNTKLCVRVDLLEKKLEESKKKEEKPQKAYVDDLLYEILTGEEKVDEEGK